MEKRRRQRFTAGLSLILVGLGLFALDRLEGLGDAAVFLVIGTAFLAAYLYRREYGLLIPGCILLGLGGGILGRRSLAVVGEPVLLGLGLGFVAIYVVALFYQRVHRWWPLIPGAILILLAIPDTDRIVGYLFENWPLVLVLIGVLIMLSAAARRGSPRHGD